MGGAHENPSGGIGVGKESDGQTVPPSLCQLYVKMLHCRICFEGPPSPCAHQTV